MTKYLAGFVFVLNLLIVAGYSLFSHLNGTEASERFNTFAFVLFPIVGSVLLARHPRNLVGYLVSIMGLSVLAASMFFEYASLSLRELETRPPFTGEAAWASMVLWTFVLPSLVLTFLYFPNGRLVGSWSRILIFITMLLNLPILIMVMVVSWPMRNQLAWMDAGQIPQSKELITMNQVFDVWNLVMIGIILLALVNFIIRFSRSRGNERQQLKWFVYGLSTIPAAMILEEMLIWIDTPLMQAFVWTINITSISAFPIVMLIAISRYRLYDIDFIIRRTLVYSALTLILALIYFGSILTMQTIFTQRVGEQPAIVIVISTILIAALFQPLRRRFQSIIDRRFYRSKYNAEKTLKRLTTQLQNQTDLEEIHYSLAAMVTENFQPERVDVWLKEK